MRLQQLFTISLCLLIGSVAFAAEKIELRQDAQILMQLQTIRATQPVVANDTLLLNILGMSRDMSAKLIRQVNEGSMSYTRYTMLFQGVPVWGEQIVIVTKDQQPVRLHGTAVRGIEQDVLTVIPAFDAQSALKAAQTLHKGSSKALWFYENETSELVIYVNGKKAQLCYAVTFFADIENGGSPTRPTYILDAQTQQVVYQFEGLTFENGTGPGGNAKTGKYFYGQQYPAFTVAYANGTSTMETKDVKTVNLNHGYSGSTAYSYQGTVNTVKEINGAYSPLNDAQFFGEVVFKMYKDWYNTAPLKFQLMLRVHYANSYENAFWDGSSMTFGDGKSRFYPLVSLDVVNHEVSHGFTEQNSGLIYQNQSGGINESFSDLAGDAAEYFMKGTNDWMVGADIFKNTGALRYMEDPTKDGRSIGSAKNYYNGMDVHYSSGVFNKAFYVLAHTSGWNTKKAFDVFVKANQVHWTPSSTFVTGAQGVVDAAKDHGHPTSDVVNAFKAVDVTVTE